MISSSNEFAPLACLKPGLIVLLALVLISLLSASQTSAAEHAVISIYHHVADDTPPSTSLSPARFKEHMEYLRDDGYTVLPLDTVITAMRNREQLPDKTIVITFDDGYTSIFTEAFPLLQSMEFPFTVFINTEPINAGRQGYMSWNDIRVMSEAGVLIANHMINHPHMTDNLPGENDATRVERLRQEMLLAEKQIKQETGQSLQMLAYPYGEYDSLLKEMLADEGFVGIAQHSGAIGFYSDFLALPRFPLAGIYAGMEGVRTKSQTLSFHVLEQEPASPVTDIRNPAVTLQFAPGDFNPAYIACYAGGEPMTIEWLDRDAIRFRIQPEQDFNSRRWGYNCTAPRTGDDRFYWYSKLWIRSTTDNRQ